jgi:hypothetical protein
VKLIYLRLFWEKVGSVESSKSYDIVSAFSKIYSAAAMFLKIPSIRNFRNIIKFNSSPIYNFANGNKVFDMNLAYFKHNSVDSKILISFRYVKQVGAKKVDRNFNFARNIEENVDTTLNRIKQNLEKELMSKSKKKGKKNADAASPEDEKEIEVG